MLSLPPLNITDTTRETDTMTTTTDRPTWAVFDITETATYQGVVQIDPARWEALYGERLDPAALTVEQVRQYVDDAGAEVHERHGNIDGQAWSNLTTTAVEQ